MRARRARGASLLLVVPLVVLVTLAAATALARPGGGHSYGGGGGGGGGGDSDFVFSLIWLLVQLVFEVPEVGIPLLVIVLLVLLFKSWASRRATAEWVASIDTRPAPPRESEPGPRQRLEALRAQDPDFSIVLFEDFLQTFWGELQRARGAGKLDELSPWLASRVIDELPRGDVIGVETPIVGALTYREVLLDATRVVVRVTIEGMFTELHAHGGRTTRWVVEHLRFERARSARSRPPQQVRVFLCPSCGAPARDVSAGRCPHCKRVVNDGSFDWVLTALARVTSEARPPQLVGTVAEEGTDRPTVRQRDADARFGVLQRRDPNVTWDAFARRVHLVFGEIQAAWSNRDVARIRPWVTDRQLESMQWWIHAYEAAGLRNRSDNRISSTELARVTEDRWYDAITVRIFATGHDWTEDDRGEVVGGSRSRERPFSEYWTFVRGSAVRGAPRGEKTCPSCGAPLSIEMGGSCSYCRAHVSSGEFDWVLSRIEQDDAYQG